jgi:hypothetical protein
MAAAVQRFGNHQMYRRYLDVCRWMADGIAARVGRRVTTWAAYYCGDKGNMTHYAFVLV